MWLLTPNPLNMCNNSNLEFVLAEIRRKREFLRGDIKYLDNSEQDIGYAAALDDIEQFILKNIHPTK